MNLLICQRKVDTWMDTENLSDSLHFLLLASCVCPSLASPAQPAFEAWVVL